MSNGNQAYMCAGMPGKMNGLEELGEITGGTMCILFLKLLYRRTNI